MVWFWIGFVVFVLVMLALDLGVFHRRDAAVSTKDALRWTGVCIAMALLFSVVVYFMYERNWYGAGDAFVERLQRESIAANEASPGEAAGRPGGLRVDAAKEAAQAPGKTAVTQFLAGWMTEYALSVDNIFVIALIFAHFRVPPMYQHRVLFWGILGALVLRGIMIGAGVQLVQRFEFLIYLLGLVLLYTAWKILRGSAEKFEPEQTWAFRWSRRILPMTSEYNGHRFTKRVDGKLKFTPLFVVLLVVETTDVVFAVDSIPAIIGITRDPFLVFTSNVFAILGLRSLYFALAGLMDKFENLKFSLAFILAFVGAKMILEFWHIQISSVVSLAVIAAALAVGIGTSFFRSGRLEPAGADAHKASAGAGAPHDAPPREPAEIKPAELTPVVSAELDSSIEARDSGARPSHARPATQADDVGPL